jgi:hypothetical protein
MVILAIRLYFGSLLFTCLMAAALFLQGVLLDNRPARLAHAQGIS